jgi:hypothetical protein
LLVSHRFSGVKFLSDMGEGQAKMNNRKNYPKDWKQKSTSCKEAAGWKCEKCKIAAGTICISWAGNEWTCYVFAPSAIGGIIAQMGIEQFG